MNDTLVKVLRTLPYVQMMELANFIAGELNRGEREPDLISAECIAEILVKVPLADTDLEKRERALLKQAFRIKRAVTVRNFAQGYSVEVQTLPGSTVTGTDLRAMFGQMLDQIVTMQVLSGHQK